MVKYKYLIINAFALAGRMDAIVLFPGCRYALPRAMRLLPFQGEPVKNFANFNRLNLICDYDTIHVERTSTHIPSIKNTFLCIYAQKKYYVVIYNTARKIMLIIPLYTIRQEKYMLVIYKVVMSVCLDYSEKNAFYFFRNRKAVRPSLLSLQAFFGVSTRRKGLPTLPQRPFCIAIRPPSPCNNGLIARRNGPLCFLDKVLPL